MSQTIPQIINDAEISLYLSVLDIQRSALFPKPINKTSPQVIYTEMKSVEWAYNQNNNFDGITATSNYLYWLCAAYNLQAIYIRTNGGGGVIPPITPPVSNVNPIEFTVSDVSQIPNGSNTLSIPAFIGYNVLFVRNNSTQGQLNNGNTYFSWDKISGIFMCFGNAVTGEDFLIQPTI